MSQPLESADPLAPLWAPNASSPAVPLRYRTGRVVDWDTSMGENVISIDGVTFNNLPVMPGLFMATAREGDSVSLLSTSDGQGITTYVIIGMAITPPDSRLSGRPDALSVIGANTENSNSAPIVFTTTTEEAVGSDVWDSEPFYTFLPGHLYKASLICTVLNSPPVTGTTEAMLRVRRGQASTSGSVLLTTTAVYNGIMSLRHVAFDYFKNDGGSAILDKLSLTIVRAGGPGTVSIYANASAPCILEISDLGTIAANDGLAILADIAASL